MSFLSLLRFNRNVCNVCKDFEYFTCKYLRLAALALYPEKYAAYDLTSLKWNSLQLDKGIIQNIEGLIKEAKQASKYESR